jgi:molecular chaperone DnaK (HSP70)
MTSAAAARSEMTSIHELYPSLGYRERMRLGIDLGTTHTVAALVDRGNYPVVSFEWGDVTPSLIAAGPRGELRFGHDAAQVAREPGFALLRSFKRLFEGAGPKAEVELGGRRYLLGELVERFLAALREDLFARSNAGLHAGEPLEAAISTPANASTAQRFLTLDAFRRAGFRVQALLNEPSAAGFEYAHRFRSTLSSKREYVLVYDLGGGTFDASLIHMEGKANEVVTSSGVSRLGGDDFDEAILELVLQKLGGPPPIIENRALLLDECRLQKEAAGPNTRKFVIDLHAVGKEPLVLAADEVYAACTPLVEQTMSALEGSLRDPRREGDAAVEWGELAGLYVVGGASSFPPVYRLMRERFGQHRVRRSPHPFGSTAIGLAISLDQGAGYTLTEKLSRTVGVFREERAGHGTSFDVLIPKDAALPATAARRYRAAHNVGHFRFVECARVEAGRPEGNVALWDEVLFPFDRALRGADLAAVPIRRLDGEGPLVEESYRCTAGGALEVKLRVLDDGFEQEVSIARRG